MERKKNIELLRSISMLLVITLHALGHGGIMGLYKFGQTGYFVSELMKTFCMVSVDCFVLITGYFLVESKMHLSRILKLILQVEFYSILCLLLTRYVFHQIIVIKDVFHVLFPLTSRQYWFATDYAVLLTLSPLLNKLIHALSKREHVVTNTILVTLFCVIPTFFFWSRATLGNGFEFTWFITLYFIAAYIRIYGINWKKNTCALLFVTFAGEGT